MPPRSVRLAISLGALGFLAILLFHPPAFVFKQNHISALNIQSIQETSPATHSVSSGLPVRLLIPRISVDAFVESVGTTKSGSMDVPVNARDAAWFNLGTRPGEVGSAVIDGHYGFDHGKPSVFDDLHKLRIGDLIYVKNDGGASVSFTISDIRRYNPSADASQIFNSSDGKAHLNLITCEGSWDVATGAYAERLVLFADKVSE